MALIPPGKTPISFLQEISTKRGITPQYDLLANEGAVHEPVFIMRVTIGEVIATGKGTSKKKAKHGAALAALQQILGLGEGRTPEQQPSEPGQPSGNMMESDVAGNPVGELQEFTQKKLIKPPIYEFGNEDGPPHNREFICTVKLGKFTEKGSGRSKKTAKRSAASAMLVHLKNITQDGENNTKIEDSEEEDEIPLNASELRASYTALKEGKAKIPIPSAQENTEFQQFYQKIKNNQKIKSTKLTTPATNYCQMLQEISEVQRFEVTYMDIAEISAKGQRQCLVQLSTMPVAVCHGVGPTVDEAHAHAAHNALHYLKLMTKT
ncbi:RISC-loading complex subunit tarbp2-like [Ostrea edulis]|uniref:RISC-loading complex subunit tarbp2-like n=1 Tax=Ostrea edulis TaxID=37623 RepID=UPI0020951397|nr:RISC-loading complex subunit tarbp2-like [Ostrea edulis]